MTYSFALLSQMQNEKIKMQNNRVKN